MPLNRTRGKEMATSSITANFAIRDEKEAKVFISALCTIIDKCKKDSDRAFFYVLRTLQNGWGRNSLLNWLSTDLYEREGKLRSAA